MAETTSNEQTLEDIESNVPQQLHPILEAAFKHGKQLIIGIVAIIAAAAIYAGMTAYNEKNLKETQTQLGSILIKESGDDKIAKLEELLKGAPAAAKPAVLLELAQSCMTNNEFEAAAGYWKQFAAEADNGLQVVATMGEAKCLTLAGKNDAALALLKKLIPSVPEALVVTANRQLAVTAEQAHDAETALEAYKTLAAQQTPDKEFIDFKITQLENK